MLTALFIRAKHWQVFLFFEALFFADLWLRAFLLTPLGYLLWVSVLVWSFRSIMHPDLKPRVGLFCAAIAYEAAVTIVFAPHPRIPIEFVLPLLILGILVSLYSVYYVAKCVTLAETPRPFGLQDALQDLPFFWVPSFRGFRGTFFSLVAPLIGIWFLQPRINALYEEALAGEFNWQTPN